MHQRRFWFVYSKSGTFPLLSLHPSTVRGFQASARRGGRFSDLLGSSSVKPSGPKSFHRYIWRDRLKVETAECFLNVSLQCWSYQPEVHAKIIITSNIWDRNIPPLHKHAHICIICSIQCTHTHTCTLWQTRPIISLCSVSLKSPYHIPLFC